MWARRFTSLAVALAVLAARAGAQDAPEKLYSAIRANDLVGLKALLDSGVSANTPGARDVTLLMFAAEAGSIDAMRLLLDRGADVNARSGFGSTALMWSVTDAKKVRLLLDRGADVNLAARSGRTALIVASFANPGADVVRMLLAKGAEVAVLDQRKVSPLNAATFGNDTATVRALLDAGADFNSPDTFIGLTPLMNAAGNRNVEMVKALLAKGAAVNAASKTENLPKIQTGTVEFGGWTPLLMASPYGPPELVQTLLDAGAKVNVQDYRGFSPLMLAVGTDRYNRETVKMLLAHGADASVKTHAGETALDWAQKFGDADVVKSLGGSPRKQPVVVRVSENELRSAIVSGMALLDKTTTQFFKTSGCMACHEQPPGEFAAGALRAKGIAMDENASKERRLQMTSTMNGPTMMEGPAGIGGADNNIYAAEGLLRSGYAPDKITDYLAASLALAQGGDGGWHLSGYSRSPIQDSDFSRTAIALRALKAYGTPGRAAEMKDRIERAKQWLLHAEPVITEDFDWRLVGGAAAGASPAELRKLAEPILSRQQSDGSWAQRDGYVSDAYATGMTLWSLAESGVVRPSDPVYGKGAVWLLDTQNRKDGSWHVVSRATKFQQYFESGFPYEHDQWISTMATGWAVNALALAVPATAGR
jgi:ankyrin repeat protein